MLKHIFSSFLESYINDKKKKRINEVEDLNFVSEDPEEL